MSYYGFVPVDSTVRTVSSIESRLKYENIFLIKLKFKAKTDIHVSSGIKKLVKKGKILEILMKHYRDSKGFPAIPGSSFKGAVSTNFLALTGNAEMTSNLFGATRVRAVISKLFFSELKPDKKDLKEVEALRQWAPRIRKQRHIKFYVARAPNTAKYGLIECIPAGSILEGQISGYNLNELELGGLLVSLGYGIENATFKIGYGKPQGFGQLELIDVKVSELKFEDFAFKEIPRKPEEFAEKFKKKFEERIERYAKIIFAGVGYA